jgi:hypothetical protein
MLLIRYLLVSLIVYLIIRSFVRYNDEEKLSKPTKGQEEGSNLFAKKVSKEVGEYIDYEEVDKKD